MMPESMLSKLKHLVVEHESYERYPYLDTEGNITIGIGYNLSNRGLPDSWINKQFNDDVTYFYTFFINAYSWFTDLNEARQIALIDMAFMGVKKFQTFQKMLSALEIHDYALASEEILSSKWATQVKTRATNIADIILTGEI